MSKVNLVKYSNRICDVFENLLDEHGIDIPDDNRTGEEEEAHIHGVTYYTLEDEIKKILIELANEIKRDDVELETESI